MTTHTNTDTDTGADAAESSISDLVRLACDIATGAISDPAAAAISTRGAWRELNAKGSGSETYRRARSPQAAWRFVSRERLPHGKFLAADRKVTIRGDVYAGDLLADYKRTLTRGTSDGEARHDGQIGLVIGPAADRAGADVEWMDAVHQKDGTWRVVLPTGAHLTFAPAGWR